MFRNLYQTRPGATYRCRVKKAVISSQTVALRWRNFHQMDCGLAGRYPTPYSVEDFHLLLHAGFDRRFQDKIHFWDSIRERRASSKKSFYGLPAMAHKINFPPQFGQNL